jgi:hypothetical protein
VFVASKGQQHDTDNNRCPDGKAQKSHDVYFSLLRVGSCGSSGGIRA